MNNAATTNATVTTLNPIPNATAQRSTALPVMDNFRFVNLYLKSSVFFGANRHSPDKRSRHLEKVRAGEKYREQVAIFRNYVGVWRSDQAHA